MRSLKNILFLPLIFIITVAFNFQHNPPSNWYQQFLPNIYTQQINDMTFLDSLTGFAITSRNSNPDTATILKTTNGGDDWNVVYNQSNRRLSRIKFINDLTGFASGGTGTGTPHLYKTTNQGVNWNLLPITTGNSYWEDMEVLNEDTIWCVDKNSLNGGVYRTTNGGMNWQNNYSAGSNNPNKIIFYNQNTGFISDNTGTLRISKTTNSCLNWFTYVDGQSMQDIHFINDLTGWRASGANVYKTTNAGVNWITQYLPSGGNFIFVGLYQMSFINSDTIWGAGGVINLGSGRFRGVILKTTNGGTNWGYQIPDTSINNFEYYHIQFVNKNTGWAYTSNRGIHTKLGGDSSIVTAIEQPLVQIPNQFNLYQNYPNPFNPATIISFDIQKKSHVSLKVYNLQGKEIASLLNQNKNPGKYNIAFDAGVYNISSGIYFYTLQTENFADTKKMILVK